MVKPHSPDPADAKARLIMSDEMGRIEAIHITKQQGCQCGRSSLFMPSLEWVSKSTATC